MNDLMKVEVSALKRDWCPYRKRQQRTGSFSLSLPCHDITRRNLLTMEEADSLIYRHETPKDFNRESSCFQKSQTLLEERQIPQKG